MSADTLNSPQCLHSGGGSQPASMKDGTPALGDHPEAHMNNSRHEMQPETFRHTNGRAGCSTHSHDAWQISNPLNMLNIMGCTELHYQIQSHPRCNSACARHAVFSRTVKTTIADIRQGLYWKPAPFETLGANKIGPACCQPSPLAASTVSLANLTRQHIQRTRIAEHE
jgi:hypothetical protein